MATVSAELLGPRVPLAIIGKRAVLPPLGLLTVAGLLPGSWDLRLVDLNLGELEDADLDWADLVMVSGMRIQRASFHEVVRRARAAGKRVVGGGPYVSTSPEDAPEMDHVVVGEAEDVLPELARALETGAAAPLGTQPSRCRAGAVARLPAGLLHRGVGEPGRRRYADRGMAMVGMLTALPSTQLWRRLAAEGRLLSDGEGDAAYRPNFITRLPPDTLISGYGRLLAALDLPRLAEPSSARATATRAPARLFTIRRRLDASPRYGASGRG